MTVRLGLAARLRSARLAWELDAATPDLTELAAAGFAAGVDLLVLVQSTMPDAELGPLHAQLRDTAPLRGLVAVRGTLTDGVDVTLLGPDGGPVRRARRRLHRWALVGLATTERASFTQLDADFLWLGAPAAPGLIAAAVQAAPATAASARPWFAAGTTEDTEELIEAGACRLALSEVLVDPEQTVADLQAMSTRLHDTWSSDPALRRVGWSH